MSGGPFQKGISQLDAVNEGDSSIITAASAIITIIKDSLFSILKEDLNETHSAG